MATALVVGSLVQLVACASFAFVAGVLLRRFAKGEVAGVVRAFACLWGAMSVFMAERGILGLAANAGWSPLGVLVAARYLEIVLVCVAAWGMAYYVGYLYTGWRPLRFALGAYFALVGVAYAAATAAGKPSGVVVSDWSVGIAPSTPFINAIYAAFGVPMLVATAAYLTLAARRIPRIQRYRVALSSSSLLAWVASGLAASIAGSSFWSFVAITVLGIVTAFAVFFAYRPPHILVRRWAPEQLEAPERRRAKERAEGLHARVLELV